MNDSSVTCCPGCKRLVEAKHYQRHVLGSVLTTIRCPCGYRGLPISLTLDEYMKWTNGKDVEDIGKENKEGEIEEN
jgi:hypothetical protein